MPSVSSSSKLFRSMLLYLSVAIPTRRPKERPPSSAHMIRHRKEKRVKLGKKTCHSVGTPVQPTAQSRACAQLSPSDLTITFARQTFIERCTCRCGCRSRWDDAFQIHAEERHQARKLGASARPQRDPFTLQRLVTLRTQCKWALRLKTEPTIRPMRVHLSSQGARSDEGPSRPHLKLRPASKSRQRRSKAHGRFATARNQRAGRRLG
jgi:hypothetical protein